MDNDIKEAILYVAAQIAAACVAGFCLILTIGAAVWCCRKLFF